MFVIVVVHVVPIVAVYFFHDLLECAAYKLVICFSNAT